jgi:L-threonate 2-dehydrogenase
MNGTVGIIGIGKIGLPIATNLLEQGFTVIGYRRHMSDDFITIGGIPAHSSKEVAKRSNVVITALPDDDALIEVVSGDNGIVQGAHPGLLVVDVGMQSLQAKEQAYHALERVGVSMLDCPISGIPPQVLARKAVLFASGDQQAIDTCMDVLKSFSGNVFYIGSFGAGLRMKCVANLLVAVHILAAAEAMTLASKAGLDLEQVVKVISPSVASSAQFVARAPMMAEGRYEPALGAVREMGEEVIAVIRSLAATCHSATPLLETAAHYYEKAIAAGYGSKDVAIMFPFLSEESISESQADR